MVWRADLPGAGEQVPGKRQAELEDELGRVRPSSLEAMTLPIHAVRAWLAEQADARGVADVIEEGPEEEARREDAAKRGRWFVRMRRGEDPEWTTLAAARPRDREAQDELRPGDVVLVPASYGGINEDGTFDPTVTAPATDLGDLAQLRGRGRATLRVTREALRSWALGDDVLGAAPGAKNPDGSEEAEATGALKDRVKRWISTWPGGDAPPEGFLGTAREWKVARAAFARLAQRPQLISGGALLLVEPVPLADLRGQDLVGDALTEDDDSSFRAAEVTLQQHSKDVQALAEQFARALGWPKELGADLALAAWLHDVGKADARFQRWLVGGDEVRAAMRGEPLAKSGLPPGNAAERRLAQQRAGYPRGYRHELLSLAMIEDSEAALATAHDRELVLHLVASHHGWCRPHAPALDHPDDLPVELLHEGVTLRGTTRHRKALANSGVAQRFWLLNEKYGWWGLAWLEAVLRLADHRASEAEAEAETETARRGEPRTTQPAAPAERERPSAAPKKRTSHEPPRADRARRPEPAGVLRGAGPPARARRAPARRAAQAAAALRGRWAADRAPDHAPDAGTGVRAGAGGRRRRAGRARAGAGV
ncbi:MAG: CRISPR-associated endonuclease Cas3'' [Myxococcales bacterium]|nr:CRISPR-associated endonuclease Cas3'' [Myxococcales bacterium]